MRCSDIAQQISYRISSKGNCLLIDDWHMGEKEEEEWNGVMKSSKE